MSRSHGYANRHGRTVARLPVTRAAVPLPAWVYMSIRLPMFSSYHLLPHTHRLPIINPAKPVFVIMRCPL